MNTNTFKAAANALAIRHHTSSLCGLLLIESIYRLVFDRASGIALPHWSVRIDRGVRIRQYLTPKIDTHARSISTSFSLDGNQYWLLVSRYLIKLQKFNMSPDSVKLHELPVIGGYNDLSDAMSTTTSIDGLSNSAIPSRNHVNTRS